MAAGNQYFTPIDTNGTQRFTESGEATGWYRLDQTPPGPLPVLSTFIPPEATGFILQAITAVQYSFSPDVSAPGTLSMTLAPGAYLQSPGGTAMQQLSIYLDGSGTDFIILFYTGNVGPMPVIFQQPGTSPGPPPPPPPGGANLPTNNVCHVMKNGSDATGTRNRMDLPFLTCAAAEAAAVAGDTIMVWNGTYDEQDLGTKFLFYILHGGTITSTTGSVFTTVEDISISGNGFIQGLSGSPAIIVADARTFKNQGIYILSNGVGVDLADGQLAGTFNIASTDTCIQCVANPGSVNITGNLTSQTTYCIDAVAGISGIIRGNVTSNGAGSALYSDSGQLIIIGNITSGGGAIENVGSAEIEVYGTVLGTAGTACLTSAPSRTNIYGNVFGATGVDMSGGYCAIYGNIEATGAAIIKTDGELQVTGKVQGDTRGFDQSGGTAIINGNITGGSQNAARATGGTLSIYGNIEAGLDGSSTAPGLLASGGAKVQLYGNAKAIGIAISLNTADLSHEGDAESTGSNAVQVAGACTIRLSGNRTAPAGFAGLRLLKATTGRCDVYGRSYGGGQGVYIQNSTGYIVHHHGDIESINGSAVLFTNGGELYLYGLVKSQSGSEVPISISQAGSNLYLMASARVVRTGAGLTITSYAPGGQALTVNSYVASGNTTIEGTLTVNGIYNIYT